MSDIRTPPTDEGHSSHPEELLAGYVDGSAGEDDRARVEAHLATCVTCRHEVQLAAAGRTAAHSLVEVPSPDLAQSVREALRAAGPPGAETFAWGARRGRSRPRAPARWQRTAVAAGLAAAAVFGAVFVVRLAATSTQSATGGAAAPVPGSKAAAPPILEAGGDYTSQSLDALAKQMASSEDRSLTGGAQQPGAVPGGSRSASPSFDRDPQHVDQALGCLKTATGLSLGVPLRLERATFEGQPAWIGAFIVPGASGGRDHAVVVAASIDGCQPLHIASQAL